MKYQVHIVETIKNPKLYMLFKIYYFSLKTIHDQGCAQCKYSFVKLNTFSVYYVSKESQLPVLKRFKVNIDIFLVKKKIYI